MSQTTPHLEFSQEEQNFFESAPSDEAIYEFYEEQPPLPAPAASSAPATSVTTPAIAPASTPSTSPTPPSAFKRQWRRFVAFWVECTSWLYPENNPPVRASSR